MDDWGWMPQLLVLVPIIVLPLVAGFFIWRRMSPLARDPDVQAARALPRSERYRLTKLARSETVISDPNDAAKARLLASSSLKSLGFSYSKRQFVTALVIVIVGVLLREIVYIAVGIGGALITGIGFWWTNRLRRQLTRTGELNGWDLQDVPVS